MNPDCSQPRILLVDDEPAIRSGLRALLEMGGFVVSEAQDVRTGIAKSESERPDLIVLDLRLPDGSGFDVLESIRKKSPRERLAVLIFTGYGDFDTSLESVRRGADGFLRKGLGEVGLLEAVWNEATSLMNSRGRTPPSPSLRPDFHR